ncbi:cupin domain-containing protein [Actinorugispora endophytica]|uniref:Cupin domain n=1 Tax=Actinorugispora endophytica TaxID=1605990 RepID=A0A4R6V2E8_9ACTN|nr:cupin domain-containing protein [Actinorugispora endophytica]TDQ54344.1 cupin domain [Actinorugispora endophytica]
MTAPLPEFPGSVGISALRVYPWEAADGLCGGSPHMHLCCTEGYVVTGGAGRLQTLTAEGYSEEPLRAGDVVWFTPGTIHRAVNDGDLRVLVLMQNGGLPEAGDAVLTLPPEHLADPAAYQRAVALRGPDGAPSPERARARRDLAVEGFAELRGRTEAGDASALDAFHAAAAALVRPRLAEWRERWERGADAASARTGREIDALAAGDHTHLRAARVSRIEQPAQDTLGMCGHLSPYDAARRGARPM